MDRLSEEHSTSDGDSLILIEESEHVKEEEPNEPDPELSRKLALQDEVEIDELPVPVWDLQYGKRNHQCDEACIATAAANHLLEDETYKVCSPFMKPLLCGWKRRGRTYDAPCGKACTSLKEIADYLEVTQMSERLGITIDQFTLDPGVRPQVLVTGSGRELDDDFALEQESTPLRVVNNLDDSECPKMRYVAERYVVLPETGDKLEYQDFCAGCSCKGNCEYSDDCACIKRSKEEAERLCAQLQSNSSAGYSFRTLEEPEKAVLSGIFECNHMCACKSYCGNRVAQNRIQIPMELFMTAQIGWGGRTRVDLPRGTFVCTYSAAVHSVQYAKVARRSLYFADINFSGTFENRKHGVESTGAENDGMEEEVRAIEPEFSLKSYFGPQRHMLVLDSGSMGNIGGFFNHSCEPNLSLQYVFHDTHDIRLPLVAFFTNQFVEAGSQLTWDYGYKVGVDKEVAITCKCGAKSCRGRLL